MDEGLQRVKVSERHLRQVVKMSGGFRDFSKKRKGNGGKDDEGSELQSIERTTELAMPRKEGHCSTENTIGSFALYTVIVRRRGRVLITTVMSFPGIVGGCPGHQRVAMPTWPRKFMLQPACAVAFIKDI